MGKVSAILASVGALKECICENEEDPVRKSEVLMSINNAVRFYKDFYEKKVRERKQSLITRFLSSPSSQPEHVSSNEEDDDRNDSQGLFDDNESELSDFEGFFEDVYNTAAVDETAPSADGSESQ